MLPLRVFIGFDKRETVAFHVLSQSIHSLSSRPVAITPLIKDQLTEIHNRERHSLQSTDFSFTRFLVPLLCDYQGISLFMDCDMVVTQDICKLFDFADPKFAVQVVKHDHRPSTDKKFLGQIQSKYEKKNWSSVMLFNNTLCKALSQEYVQTASGLELHQFKWLESEEMIGELPPEWNYLVGEQSVVSTNIPANIHYTLGGPYFEGYEKTEYSEIWNQVKLEMLYVDNQS